MQKFAMITNGLKNGQIVEVRASGMIPLLHFELKDRTATIGKVRELLKAANRETDILGRPPLDFDLNEDDATDECADGPSLEEETSANTRAFLSAIEREIEERRRIFARPHATMASVWNANKERLEKLERAKRAVSPLLHKVMDASTSFAEDKE